MFAVSVVVARITSSMRATVPTAFRKAKAQADTRTLASAVSIYTAHMGTLPAALTALTAAAVNDLNQRAGPLMSTVPAPLSAGTPAWGAYGEASSTPGRFSITATGDGT